MTNDGWVTEHAIVEVGCARGCHVTVPMVRAAVAAGTLLAVAHHPLRICASSANQWLHGQLANAQAVRR